MQIVRTVIWIVVTILLVSFVAMNWTHVPVNFWPLSDGYLFLEWPVGVVAIAFFLLGMLPMWLLHRAARWRYHRRISSLENSVRLAAQPPEPPAIEPVSPDPSEVPHEPTFTKTPGGDAHS